MGMMGVMFVVGVVDVCKPILVFISLVLGLTKPSLSIGGQIETSVSGNTRLI